MSPTWAFSSGVSRTNDTSRPGALTTLRIASIVLALDAS